MYLVLRTRYLVMRNISCSSRKTPHWKNIQIRNADRGDTRPYEEDRHRAAMTYGGEVDKSRDTR